MSIGIRPGEKLHETMIPADDAHCTVELEDRYVILQSFANAARDAYLHRGAKPVPEGFSYSSDTNPGTAGCPRPADPAADGLCLTAIGADAAARLSALWPAGNRRHRHQGGGRGAGVAAG